MRQSDTELLRKAREGDEVAFHELVDRHAGHLFGVAYALLGNAADAEDAVQETLAGAFSGMSGFREQASVRTWLLRILVRQAARVRRSRLWRRIIPLRAPESETLASTQSGGSDAKADVAEMLKTLSPEHREVIVLREFEGLSYEEIAAALNVPRGTVESRLFRARQELKQRFREYLGD